MSAAPTSTEPAPGSSAQCSETASVMNLRWEKLSPSEFEQLQDLVSRSTKKVDEVLSEFSGNGRFAGYNHNEEVDLNGFRAFIITYLEAETPETLIRHIFSSFVKTKPAQQQEVTLALEVHSLRRRSLCHHFQGIWVAEDQEETAGPSSEPAAKDETPRAPPKADHSDLPGTSKDPDTNSVSMSSLADTKEGLLLARGEGNSKRTGPEEIPSKEANNEQLSPSYHGSEGEKSFEMTARPKKFPFFFFFFFKKSGDLVDITDSSDIEGTTETSLIKEEEDVDVGDQLVPLKDIARYFSLLQSGSPQGKLEFVFRLYDTDGDGVLNKNETECVVDQMMNVAEYLGWDVTQLRPILTGMMKEIDYDEDGIVCLEDWIRGGMTTVPLLALLGLDSSVREDGHHVWRRKVFMKPAYCNLCLNMIVGLATKGLCCVFCKITVHERCAQSAPNNCIMTYSKKKSSGHSMMHHWVEGNYSGQCFRCKKSIKFYKGINGLRCRWCQTVLHNRCAEHVSPVCNLGVNYVHVIPPAAIYPVVLDRPPLRNVNEVELPAQPSQPTAFRIEPMPGSKPLLVFVNPKSGGLQGAELERKFQYHLNPKQVYNLLQDDPKQALQLFKDVKGLRVICCGGDGTVGWILDMIDRANFDTHPTVGVVPLGTGNDLARCLHWGGGYDGEPIPKLLRKMEEATMVMLDRWNIKIVTDAGGPGSDNTVTNVLTNYFSVGVDAAICIKFHTEREKHPEKFNSRIKNKLLYFEFATSETFSASCRNLQEDVEMECDGEPLDLAGGQPLQGIAILNIPSTHGGTNLWGDGPRLRRLLDEYKRRLQQLHGDEEDEEESDSSGKIDLDKTMQDLGDGLIEVVGLENCLHMGQVRTGLRASARRLAQSGKITMRTKRQLPMQIDGEPWMQDPCTITISHRCQVPMLRAPKSN